MVGAKFLNALPFDQELGFTYSLVFFLFNLIISFNSKADFIKATERLTPRKSSLPHSDLISETTTVRWPKKLSALLLFVTNLILNPSAIEKNWNNDFEILKNYFFKICLDWLENWKQFYFIFFFIFFLHNKHLMNVNLVMRYSEVKKNEVGHLRIYLLESFMAEEGKRLFEMNKACYILSYLYIFEK